jgi:hypothetical protein
VKDPGQGIVWRWRIDRNSFVNRGPIPS